MGIDTHHLASLKELVGDKAALDIADDLSGYLTEPRGKFQGTTPLVLLPDSREKVAAIVSYCAEHKIKIIPQGGNTGLVGGSIPTRSGDEIILSLKRMTKIRELDLANQTMTVEAGCILATIQDHARAHDFLFPLSLAAEGSCQIGGNLSTNAGGVNVLHYGTMRDLVLGLEVVLPDGTLWHGLTGLRKDNTGYDLKQLFIGAEGTLGVITAATLKLYPYPHQQQTAMVAVPDPRAAIELLTLSRKLGGGCLTAFELMPRRGLEMVITHMTGQRDPMAEPHDWYILLEVTSPIGQDLLDLERVMERLLSEAMERGWVTDGVIAKNETESQQLWMLRENLSEAQKHDGGSIKHDIALPISAIADFLDKAGGIVRQLIPGARPVPFGHLGDGNLHYNVSQPRDMNKAEFLAQWEDLNQHIHDLVMDCQGSFSAEHGIGRLKINDMQRYKSEIELTLMRKLKATLDPDHILNPGVIVK